ncbi:putative dynein heavy chain [Leptomonas pyrrhocoris]|uniref:Putative dynein heavy chain n=1 Tax=Leptomonas pyrrhocoris TaxID=157538 RepID=A0A0M9FPD2_LEPPY|nr:putative dynein heavy chain [Leptomonas pyrrhocoris]KPA73156.1 putative dynein heavy chain [Leptomonas pyrrhocoris]|eukprot:XP_015651595.1 putative dynein heavy chain [Leptomonas pyrrhocoris]
MYQNSLQSYMSIFQEALMNSAKSSEAEERTEAINTTFKRSLYQRICRSLFARDQLLFSFTMSLKIYGVDPTLLRWVLMGGFEDEDHHAVPNPFTWLPELIWKLLRRAATQLDGFAHLTELLQQHAMFFMDFYESSNPLELELPGVLNDMSSIEKPVVVRCLRMDKVVPAIRNYVSDRTATGNGDEQGRRRGMKGS